MLKYKWILLIVLALAGFGFWRFKSQPKVSREAVRPVMQSIVESLDLSGSVDAVEKVSLPYGSGKIGWVGVKEDQVVKKWQLMATMDTKTLQKQLEADLNTFNKSFRDHDATLDTYDYYGNSGVSTEVKRILEKANYDLKNSVITVELRDLAIKMSSIATPIEGIVTRVDKPFGGVYAGATDVIQVVNPKTIYFSAVVDETDVAKVSDGLNARIALDAYPEATIASTVAQVDFSPSVSRSGGTGYKVHLPMTYSGDSRYRLGMNGTVTIILNQKDNAMTIPAEALIYRDGKAFVDVKTKTGEEKRAIVTGLESDDVIEVTSGLTLADEVLLPAKKGK